MSMTLTDAVPAREVAGGEEVGGKKQEKEEEEEKREERLEEYVPARDSRLRPALARRHGQLQKGKRRGKKKKGEGGGEGKRGNGMGDAAECSRISTSPSKKKKKKKKKEGTGRGEGRGRGGTAGVSFARTAVVALGSSCPYSLLLMAFTIHSK